jgi:Putative peptidoglycan binding domain
MGKLFKRISSLVDGHGGASTPPADSASRELQRTPLEATAAQESLPLHDDVLDAQDPLPPAKRHNRALNAVARASSSVVVTRPTMPMVPMHPQPAQGPGGVELTETEQVRLQIMQAQIKLTSLGLYEGPINGIMSLDTIAGVRYFQTLKGMRESGQLTAATMRALMGPASRRH